MSLENEKNIINYFKQIKKKGHKFQYFYLFFIIMKNIL